MQRVDPTLVDLDGMCICETVVLAILVMDSVGATDEVAVYGAAPKVDYGCGL